MLEICAPDGSMFDAFMLQVGRDWRSAHRKFSGPQTLHTAKLTDLFLASSK
jgi:hypothetical protein